MNLDESCLWRLWIWAFSKLTLLMWRSQHCKLVKRKSVSTSNWLHVSSKWSSASFYTYLIITRKTLLMVLNDIIGRKQITEKQNDRCVFMPHLVSLSLVLQQSYCINVRYWKRISASFQCTTVKPHISSAPLCWWLYLEPDCAVIMISGEILSSCP